MLIIKDETRTTMKMMMCLFSLISNMAFANTLFVCAEDINRCYIAKVVATKFLYHPSQANSLNKVLRPDTKTLEVLNAWNIEESSHIDVLDGKALENADLVLTMTQEEKQQLIRAYPQIAKKTWTLSQYAKGETVDIAALKGKNLKTYEQTRNQIFQYEDLISVRGWICDALHH